MNTKIEFSVKLDSARIENIHSSSDLSPSFLLEISKFLDQSLIIEKKLLNSLTQLRKIDSPIHKIFFSFENKEESFMLDKLFSIFSLKKTEFTQGIEDITAKQPLGAKAKPKIGNEVTDEERSAKIGYEVIGEALAENGVEDLANCKVNKGLILDSKPCGMSFMPKDFNKSLSVSGQPYLDINSLINERDFYIIDEAWNFFNGKLKHSFIKKYLNKLHFLSEQRYRQFQKQTLLMELSNKKKSQKGFLKSKNNFKSSSCNFKQLPIKRRFY